MCIRDSEHTAVKIAPGYEHPTIHVIDASRAVGVSSKLLSEEGRDPFVTENIETQEALREKHLGKREAKPLLGIAEAREHATKINWRSEDISQPEFTGIRTESGFPLETLVDYIDWSPFFHAWELRGRFPKILEDEVVGEKAKELFDDAQSLLLSLIHISEPTRPY